jgi:hypothetical protein
MEHFNDSKNFSAITQYYIGVFFKIPVLQGLVEDLRTAKPSGQQQDPVIVVACPGLCRTNMGRDFSALVRFANNSVQKFLARTAEKGSRELVSGTLLGAEAHGKFWSNDALDERLPLMSPQVWNTVQKQSWSEIKAILSEHCPWVQDILGGT